MSFLPPSLPIRQRADGTGSKEGFLNICLSKCYFPKKKPFKEEYLEMPEKSNIEFSQGYLFYFLMIFMNGIKYYGALHL
jgi:hypothetical protein